MSLITNKKTKAISSSKELLLKLTPNILDPLGRDIAQKVEWWSLPNCSTSSSKESTCFPVAVVGKGPPIICLHGFDSSFLEFRRLAPLLKNHHQLIIPDLFGFGFCPRFDDIDCNSEMVITHLEAILNEVPNQPKVGLIGASMGGAVAMELARRNPQKINKVLLLAPAGLTGKPMPMPKLLSEIGVWFLSRPLVRRNLCRQAFASPETCVGDCEEQIASLHLQVPGWSDSLASFAHNGGFIGFGSPVPKQELHVIWGKGDRILSNSQKKEVLNLLGKRVEEIANCGHLPHLDHPEIVAARWLKGFNLR